METFQRIFTVVLTLENILIYQYVRLKKLFLGIGLLLLKKHSIFFRCVNISFKNKIRLESNLSKFHIITKLCIKLWF